MNNSYQELFHKNNIHWTTTTISTITNHRHRIYNHRHHPNNKNIDDVHLVNHFKNDDFAFNQTGDNGHNGNDRFVYFSSSSSASSAQHDHYVQWPNNLTATSPTIGSASGGDSFSATAAVVPATSSSSISYYQNLFNNATTTVAAVSTGIGAGISDINGTVTTVASDAVHHTTTASSRGTELPLFKVEFTKILSTTSSTSLLVNDTTQQIATIVLEPDLRVHYPALAILLSMICVIVVFGNGLTMLSICKERYLRTVTNYFVASLAFADCLVGAIVMPFSIVHEVMNKWWIFGQDWCDLWHSFDVLASSASILNLCVISLDRYWAITDPMTYPSRMTPRKAFIFILSLWLCSALISFPAIVWWRAVQKPPEPYRCTFTDDVGYLVFSSIISFYGPLTIMVFTYYRIYVVASEQNRSLKLGVKQIEMSYIGHENQSHQSTFDHTGSNNVNNPSMNPEYRSGFTLRIHRGGGAASRASSSIHYPRDISTTATTKEKLNRPKMSSVSTTSSMEHCDSLISGDHNLTNNHHHNAKTHSTKQNKNKKLLKDISTLSFDSNNGSSTIEPEQHRSTTAHLVRNHHHHHHHHSYHHNHHNNNQNNKNTNWSVGRRLTKLAKERKAAKTLGIVMGVFILCWLPFFVTNILMGICPETCILEPDLVFSIVTWLGWINSAMNPIIYACWSKDFRRAFRKLLCSCFMRNSSLSYNRNRIYKAHNHHHNQNANVGSSGTTIAGAQSMAASRYNYNMYYKSRIKNRQQMQQDFSASPSSIGTNNQQVLAQPSSSLSSSLKHRSNAIHSITTTNLPNNKKNDGDDNNNDDDDNRDNNGGNLFLERSNKKQPKTDEHPNQCELSCCSSSSSNSKSLPSFKQQQRNQQYQHQSIDQHQSTFDNNKNNQQKSHCKTFNNGKRQFLTKTKLIQNISINNNNNNNNIENNKQKLKKSCSSSLLHNMNLNNSNNSNGNQAKNDCKWLLRNNNDINVARCCSSASTVPSTTTKIINSNLNSLKHPTSSSSTMETKEMVPESKQENNNSLMTTTSIITTAANMLQASKTLNTNDYCSTIISDSDESTTNSQHSYSGHHTYSYGSYELNGPNVDDGVGDDDNDACSCGDDDHSYHSYDCHGHHEQNELSPPTTNNNSSTSRIHSIFRSRNLTNNNNDKTSIITKSNNKK